MPELHGPRPARGFFGTLTRILMLIKNIRTHKKWSKTTFFDETHYNGPKSHLYHLIDYPFNPIHDIDSI